MNTATTPPTSEVKKQFNKKKQRSLAAPALGLPLAPSRSKAKKVQSETLSDWSHAS